jgi:protoporphyrin/coproporphyrin ferrochelatase
MSSPFDAVLYIAFGGPQGPDDIRPFLQNVLRGRRIPAERIDAVAHHYELFNGVSPLTAITERQARGLATRLDARGLGLPVHIGMRNWRPLLEDTLRDLTMRGARRVIGLIAAAHRSYSSCEQYKQNVWQAQDVLVASGVTPAAIVYASDWHRHTGFIEAVAARIREARATLPVALQSRARVVFTAHSIPTTMSAAATYQRGLRESAEAVASALGVSDWAMTYQSRSGRPEDPWLEPDVNDYLRAERAKGLEAVVLSPIGFLADHIEVLYDLDVEARETCEAEGIAYARASAVNDHPRFLDALADAVTSRVQHYRTGRPLPLLPAEAPARREPPPPIRPQAGPQVRSAGGQKGSRSKRRRQ